MIYAIILFAVVATLGIMAVIVSLSPKQAIPQIGDHVLISGKYNPDTGWIDDMKDTTGLRGMIMLISYGCDNEILYGIALENGDQWHYSREDFIVL